MRKYEPRPYEVKETRDLLIFGEEPDPPGDRRKRIRVLSRFTFFHGKPDAETHLNMVSLDVVADGGGDDRHVFGAGFTVAKYDVDEDEVLEDVLDEDANRLYIRTSRVLRYFTKYQEPNRYV